MPDSKITALASIGTGTDPANDPLVIVDVSDVSPSGMSATGTTKKVTLNNLLACSPTATLASATITGDLTVRTTRLTTTTTGVGIGTATPILPLDVRGTAGAGALFLKTTDPTAPVASAYIQTPVSTGFSSTVPMYGFWYQNCGMGNPASENLSWIISSSEAMRLNSTGLGVGGIASGLERFVVYSGGSKMMSIDTNGTFFADGGTGKGRLTIENSSSTNSILSTTTLFGSYNILKSAASQYQWFIGSSTQAMTLDASGSLLVGTTSSLQNTSHSFKALGTSNSFWASTFQHDGTTGSPRLLGWRLPNSSDSNAYFVYAINSGGNCFNVFGNGSVTNSTGTYGTISDLRLKENISDARNYLADLLKLRVVKYSLKSEASAVATKIGLIAQEVEQVFPTLVETNSDEVKSIKTTVLIPMLLKAIQELTARVEALEA